MNNENLLMNIIKNSENNLIDKEVLLNIDARIKTLESSLKLQKEFEYNYNKLKIKELEEEIDEFEFQKKFYIQRNIKILNNIQNNNFKSFDLFSKSNKIIESINDSKNKYQEYLNNTSDIIEKEFNSYLFIRKNIFIKEKEKEMKRQKKIEHKYDFYDELEKINEKIVNDIKKIRKRNEEINNNNENKKLKYFHREKLLKEILNNPKEKEEEKFVEEI